MSEGRFAGSGARASTRLVVAIAFGLAVGVGVSPFVAWQLSVLLGFNAFAGVFLAAAWRIVLRSDSDRTAAIATREDETQRASGLALLIAATASLLAVVAGLVKANEVGQPQEMVLTVTSVLAIVGAWAIVSTHFAFHYACLYYQGPDGGIDFKSDQKPDYLDFIYVAFTVGMTYQVSDTDIKDRAIRRSVTRHAVLSYLFGTGIIATTINVVAGLIG